MNPLVSLIAANAAFVGSHFALSHPLRAGLVRALGEKGFLGIYSLVSLALFAWIVLAFLRVGPGEELLWNGRSDALWVTGSLMTIAALVLVFASFKGNPAIPGAPAELATREPAGVFTVTRHPFLWGATVWAIAHILVSPSPRTLVTAGAMGVLALAGAALQDRKKAALLGEAWRGWQAKTSFWPNWGALLFVGWGLWLAAIVAWVAITWLHVWLAYVPAGIWRWVG